MENKGEAPRFAVPHEVSIDPVKFQDWDKALDSFKWSHRIHAPNAVSLNFGFTKFYLPEGAELNIFSTDRTKFIRTFTSEDNNIHDELWTPVILSDDVIIELSVPENAIDEVQLELGEWGKAFVSSDKVLLSLDLVILTLLAKIHRVGKMKLIRLELFQQAAQLFVQASW